MKYFIKCWKQYADFKGRARRKEYWMFLLFNYIISFILGTIYYIGVMFQAFAKFSSGEMHNMAFNGLYFGSGWVLVIFCIMMAYGLVVLLPTLAVMVRRLHDIGRKGTWLFLLLVPIPLYVIMWFNIFTLWVVLTVGILMLIYSLVITILYIVLGCIDGQKGENQYGPNPKEMEDAEKRKELGY
ncbi:MAG: DUF805 domain-containing protein [Bacteroidales bacterium]|nr:DUF805 domain-containing protein [Bacteroidales bacterium]